MSGTGIKIQALGVTATTKKDEVVLVMRENDMPPDCYVVFIKKEDYPEFLRLLKEGTK